MIQPFNSIDFSQLMIITLLVYLLTDLRIIFMAIDFCWCQVLQKPHKLFQHHQDYDQADSDDEEDDERPSPSQFPVPFMAHVVSNLIKTKLPVVEFSRSRLRGDIDEQSSSAVCVICLACIKGSEEIRELGNCSHLYHRECIDGWVDQGHGTCPLCSLNLLPADDDHDDKNEEVKGVYDPWRLERMAYLFGEDY